MFLLFLCVCFREYYVFMHWGLFMNWIRGSLEFNVQWRVIGYCWHFSAKSAFFLHLFLTVLNSSTRNHQNLMMLPRLLYSLASILILFFGEFQTKRVENYQVWRWSPLTKEWREVAAARRKLSYTVWTRKLVADQFAWLCKWRNYQKEQIMTSKVICN